MYNSLAAYLNALQTLHTGNLVDGMVKFKSRWNSVDLGTFKQKLMERNPNWIDKLSQLEGKSVIITGEQGYGDEMMFSTVIPLIADKTTRITVIASKNNYNFLKHNLDSDKVTVLDITNTLAVESTKYLKAHDTVVTSGDLYSYYCVEHGIAPSTLVKYAAIAPSEESNGKIAIAYMTNSKGDNYKERSITPDKFEVALKEFKVISFQKPEEHKLTWATSYANKVDSFADTANYLHNTACTVTCDTALTHLSLLMHKPTMIVHRKYIDWRWKCKLYSDVELCHYSDASKMKNFVISNLPKP